MMILDGPRQQERDRTPAYAALTVARAGNESVPVPPLQLTRDQRRLHVRRTLREDHQFRIQNRPEGAQAKFDTLADDLYRFFRGTALLYYRDHAGTDADLPRVVTLGDVHPGNFGVMPNENGAPIFGVNDFDEATVAPFSYDVKRGAMGFWLRARENGHGKDEAEASVRSFVSGYLNGLREFAQDERESRFEYRIDTSPDLIRETLEDALTDRSEFLDEHVDLETCTFRSTDEVVPVSSEVERFQEIVDDYVDSSEVEPVGMRDGYFRVLDVARKRGSGTASLGLDRFWVLVDGEAEDDDRCVILEMKQARVSALDGLVPPRLDDDGTVVEKEARKDEGAAAEKTVQAQKVHLVGGDPLYGHAEIDGRPFFVRERSPLKDDVDTDELSPETLATYAEICGRALAQPHARSDEAADVLDDATDLHDRAEAAILGAVDPDLFADDVLRHAKAAAKRLKKDWKHFKKDHALGAFAFFRED